MGSGDETNGEGGSYPGSSPAGEEPGYEGVNSFMPSLVSKLPDCIDFDMPPS